VKFAASKTDVDPGVGEVLGERRYDCVMKSTPGDIPSECRKCCLVNAEPECRSK
jgi:hypothetical protein